MGGIALGERGAVFRSHFFRVDVFVAVECTLPFPVESLETRCKVPLQGCTREWVDGARFGFIPQKHWRYKKSLYTVIPSSCIKARFDYVHPLQGVMGRRDGQVFSEKTPTPWLVENPRCTRNCPKKSMEPTCKALCMSECAKDGAKGERTIQPTFYPVFVRSG